MAQEEFHNYLRLLTLLHDYGGKTLRGIFKTRYKYSQNTEWVDASQASKDFHQTLGKPVFKSSQSIQKQMLREGDLQKWDLPLIYAVLQRTDFSKGVAPTKKKHDDENKIIAELIQVRNKIQHSPGKQIPHELFSELWQVAETSLVNLGVPSEEIEHVKTCKDLHGIEFKCSDESNHHENTLKAKKLKEDGNEATRSNQLDRAIQLYSQGLNLYGVSLVEQGILYSNRSSVYLRLSEETEGVEDEVSENLRLAEEDAKTAIELRPMWWKGYIRLGKVHQVKKDWKQAINAFDQALGLNVGDKEILNARDSCRFQLESETIEEHLHPQQLEAKLDTDELFEKLKRERGLHKGTADETIRLNKMGLNSGDPLLRSLSLVFVAHRYMHGTDGYNQDYKKAAEYFKEASDIGNAEALYNIGFLYQLGRGVHQDVFKAVEYFEKAVKCPMDGFLGGNRIGVVASQYAIGKCYADGVGKPKNYFKAVEWYTLASKNGSGQASNNLAFCYRNGLGVERNQGRAIQYWKCAAYTGETLALESLAWEYLHLQNYTKAEDYFSQALWSGNTISTLKQKHFEKEIDRSRSREAAFSKAIGMMGEKHKEFSHFIRAYMTEALSTCGNRPSLPLKKKSIESSAISKCWHRIEEIQTKAAAGFQYAQKILSAMQYFMEGINYLNTVLDNELCSISNSQRSNIVRAFSDCYKETEIVACYSSKYREKLFEISVNIMKTFGEEKSDADCNARICYSALIANSLGEDVNFLGMCSLKYPQERFFPSLQIYLLVFLQRNEEALEILREALKKFPDDVDLLQANANILFVTHSKFVRKDTWKEVERAFKDFLKMAPPDHRKIPDAYYCLGSICMLQNKPGAKYEQYYRMGLEAEKNLLSCFLPFDSDHKKTLELTLNSEANANPSLKKTATTFDKTSTSSFPLSESAMPILELDLHSNHLQQTNPVRTYVVLKHRHSVKATKSRDYNLSSTSKPLNEQRLPSQLTGLKSIMLDDMDCTLDHVYTGRVLHATIMEDGIFNAFTSIPSVIKDENGDFITCFFYNFDHNDEATRRKLSFGSKISIINPYHRLTAELYTWGIRVDDPQTVVFHSTGDEESLCRFCWAGGAKYHCAKCNRVNYCSKECQRQDWDLLKHKLICNS